MRSLIVILVLIFASFSFAKPKQPSKVQIKVVQMVGSCNPQNTQVTLAPDQKSISVLFDDFYLNTTQTSSRTCNIRVKFLVPKKMGAYSAHIDYRGYTQVAGGHWVQFWNQSNIYSPSVFVDKSTGDNQIFHGPYEQDINFSGYVENRNLRGVCGREFDLTLNFVVKLVNQAKNQEISYIGIDSLDATTHNPTGQEIKYNMNWYTCP